MTEGLAWPCQRRSIKLISKVALENGQIELFARELRDNLGSVNRHRTLFKTARRIFGLGHVGVEVDDRVTLIWYRMVHLVM
ncbi:hypothetical protein CI238_12556 [Colletotrichum incanum]|uniref:Uncharacterized protein n=1 Tax=Colletotrichum incanum TaxID=1573173 RepID=A0A161WJS3_COLIC|nr:hypothetical protein CI238_12556 [Colletotrichum incanum]